MNRSIFIAVILISLGCGTGTVLAQKNPQLQPMESRIFRGQRVAPSDMSDSCRISSIYTSHVQAGTQVDVIFSSAIDAQSLRSRNIYVNDRSIGDTKLTFNRDCTQVRFVVAGLKADRVSVRIENVKSYNGKSLPVLRK